MPNPIQNPDVSNPVVLLSALVPNAKPPREEWEALAAARAALSPDELIAVNVDVQIAATTALARYPEIVAIRAQAVADLPRFDPTAIDELPMYASAAYHSQTLVQIAEADPQALPALNEEATQLRDLLYTDLSPLVKRGLAPAGRLKEYKGTRGYRVVAADLAMLAETLRSCWDVAQSRTTSTLADIVRAEQLGQTMSVLVSRKEQGPSVSSASTLDRQRAFTLFVRRYDEVRRAVTYLRWLDNDAERIAPSLYAGKTRAPKSDDAPDDADSVDAAGPSIPASAVGSATAGSDLHPFAS